MGLPQTSKDWIFAFHGEKKKKKKKIKIYGYPNKNQTHKIKMKKNRILISSNSRYKNQYQLLIFHFHPILSHLLHSLYSLQLSLSLIFDGSYALCTQWVFGSLSVTNCKKHRSEKLYRTSHKWATIRIEDVCIYRNTHTPLSLIYLRENVNTDLKNRKIHVTVRSFN